MTTAEERTRSLRWAHELLSEIDSDPMVAEDLRGRARALVETFPSPEAIQELVESQADRLPERMATAIESARTLFVDIQLSATGASSTRNSLLYTLRHFPLKGAADHAKRRFAGGVDDWLARDSAAPSSRSPS
jgi:hypothetical protein